MISTKGRYALRVMLDLAEHDTGEAVPLKTVAERQEISKKYLEIIVKDLVKQGLLLGSSGKGGGYKLSRKPEEYSLAEILTLTEGTLAPVSCLCDGASPCDRSTPCPTLPVWEELERIITEYLSSVTLADILPKE
jgi:Rrf2 family protein